MMLAQALIENIPLLVEAVPILVQSLINGFINSDLFTKSKEWGKELIQNLIEGILSMLANLGKAVLNVAKTISEYLHFSVPDKGPLVSVPKWMPDMIDEMTNGIYANEDKLKTAAGSLASALESGMTMNANLQNVTKDQQEVIVNSPVYLDGKLISKSTEKYITSHQSAYAMAKGKLNVRF